MATAEPYTFRTVTPWAGWREYKEAFANCTLYEVRYYFCTFFEI